MTRPNPMAAALLEASAAGYAAHAAELLLERHAELARRCGPRAFELWRDHLTRCLRELGAVLRAGQPRHFADHAAWTKVAFEARQVPLADLRASLQCARHVLLAELPEAARDGLHECFDAALVALESPNGHLASAISASTPAGRLAAQYLEAVLGGDRRGARHAVLDAVAQRRIGVEAAYLDVLLPAQCELGRMWHLDEITVAEEHFGTATTIMVMAQLLPLGERREPVGKTAIVGAVCGDLHDVGARAVADLLDLDGWRVVPCGADLPPDDLAASAAALGADLVVLSATLATQRAGAAETIAALARRRDAGGRTSGGGQVAAGRAEGPERRPPVLVGGRAFEGDEQLWRAVGADACAASVREAVGCARRLVGLPPR